MESTGLQISERPQRTAEGTETAAKIVTLQPARHSVTFREITLRPFLLRVPKLPRVASARTPPLDALASPSSASRSQTRPYSLPVSNATRKIAQRALDYLASGNTGTAH